MKPAPPFCEHTDSNGNSCSNRARHIVRWRPSGDDVARLRILCDSHQQAAHTLTVDSAREYQSRSLRSVGLR
jgi:hypothetical protein